MASIEIERLLRNELKDTISFWTKKFANTFARHLGLTRADIMNEMRERIWKGLLTYDKSKGANVKTYMNRIIENRFKELAKRCEAPKYKNLTHFADVYASTGFDAHLVSEDTPESVFEQREELMIRLASLNQFESDRVVLMHLAMGHGLDDMEEATGLSRPIIVGAVKRIDAMLRLRRAEQDDT